MHRVYSLVRRCPNPHHPSRRRRFRRRRDSDALGLRPSRSSGLPAVRLPLALSLHPCRRCRSACTPRPGRAQGGRLARRFAGSRPPSSTGSARRSPDDFVTQRLRDDTTARLTGTRSSATPDPPASASYEAYLVPLGAQLEVDEVVCTRLERDASGRLTGRLLGANCRGPGEGAARRDWLGAGGARRRRSSGPTATLRATRSCSPPPTIRSASTGLGSSPNRGRIRASCRTH